MKKLLFEEGPLDGAWLESPFFPSRVSIERLDSDPETMEFTETTYVYEEYDFDDENSYMANTEIRYVRTHVKSSRPKLSNQVVRRCNSCGHAFTSDAGPRRRCLTCSPRIGASPSDQTEHLDPGT